MKIKSISRVTTMETEFDNAKELNGWLLENPDWRQKSAGRVCVSPYRVFATLEKTEDDLKESEG